MEGSRRQLYDSGRKVEVEQVEGREGRRQELGREGKRRLSDG